MDSGNFSNFALGLDTSINILTMAKIKGDILVNVERCKGCEVCIAACPSSTIAMSKEVNGKGYHFAMKVNNDCTGCMNCAIVCPDGVITVFRGKVAE